MKSTLFAIGLLTATTNVAFAEVEIPRSVMGDKGRYYLVNATRNGDVITTLHKRVGVSSTGWSLCEINCRTRLMRELGYSEQDPNGIEVNPTKWFELVPGSSKSDLVNFVCAAR